MNDQHPPGTQPPADDRTPQEIEQDERDAQARAATVEAERRAEVAEEAKVRTAEAAKKAREDAAATADRQKRLEYIREVDREIRLGWCEWFLLALAGGGGVQSRLDAMPVK